MGQRHEAATLPEEIFGAERVVLQLPAAEHRIREPPGSGRTDDHLPPRADSAGARFAAG